MILCVDVGGTSTKVGLVSSLGETQSVRSIATQPDVETYFKNLAQLIESGLDPGITQMGVAVAGFLDESRSRLVYNSNLSWLEDFPLKARLADRFPQLTIELEVDSNAATMAEYQLGSGRGSRRFLCLTAGTGLGVGFAIDGRPVRFSYGCLGDMGHIILARDGPLCTCGGRGCAEALLSSNTLAAEFSALSGSEQASLRELILAAQAGDRRAMEILERAGEWLGFAISSMANIFFPDHIAVAGGLSAAGEIVLAPAERVFRESACVLARSQATLTRATLGSMATLIGAAWPFWRESEGKR
ncbi:MAG TPA: ROK family protein [Bryobacteraceae bacterium]|nr:ROK family protein [Bryobacteraceae bacterium]